MTTYRLADRGPHLTLPPTYFLFKIEVRASSSLSTPDGDKLSTINTRSMSTSAPWLCTTGGSWYGHYHHLRIVSDSFIGSNFFSYQPVDWFSPLSCCRPRQSPLGHLCFLDTFLYEYVVYNQNRTQHRTCITGHDISAEGIRLLPSKVKTVTNIPNSTCSRQVQEF